MQILGVMQVQAITKERMRTQPLEEPWQIQDYTLWQPMDGTAVSTVSSEQEFLIFHQLGSLSRVTDRQAQAVTLKYLKIFRCEPL